MTEDSKYSEFHSAMAGTVFLSVVLFIICLCIVVFCPVNDSAVASIEDDSDAENKINDVALEIACTADFIAGSHNSADFISGAEGLYIRDFLITSNSTSGDKGLDFYRNPQTRGAVEWFYLRVTGNRNTAFAILEAADRENIPLSLAFAVAYTESRFNSKAVNRNVNGSVDRGLFQLNDRSFPQLEDRDFFSPQVSASYGMKHLRFCRSVAKDDLVATAMYNAGVSGVKNNQTPKSTLAYVSNIAKYRSQLETEFEREVVQSFKDYGDYTDEKEF